MPAVGARSLLGMLLAAHGDIDAASEPRGTRCARRARDLRGSRYAAVGGTCSRGIESGQRHADTSRLTASEQRVAELPATGITNREMTTTPFISPKTVEANLSRVCRLLNIPLRAELGRIIGRADE